jgi:site-specific recombinase XerD
MNDFFNTIRSFLLEYLPNQRCFSENTIRSYRQALNLLILYLRTEQRLSIKQIRFDAMNREMILNFLIGWKLTGTAEPIPATNGLWYCGRFLITPGNSTAHRLH